jgi:hypothetical protein
MRIERDTLSVAARHLDDVRAELDLLSPALLPSAVAFATDGNCNLVAGSALVGGPAEDVPRHQKERGVFVECCVGFSAELGHGFAEGCEGFSGDFHAQDVSAERWIRGVIRPVAGLVTRHELFDLAQVSTAGSVEPGAEEGAAFFAIETRTILGDSRKLLVGALPVGMLGAHSPSLARVFGAPWLARGGPITWQNAWRGVE